MNETDTKEKVHAAITNSEYIWRTATGIAAATGLSLEAVMDVLEQADGFLEADSRNSRGKALYTTIDKYHSETAWQRRLLDAMTNSVGI
nr:hypothetical protein [uncultured Duganella sp.]